MEFLVKHDFNKYRPSAWNATYTKRFGPNNEGFVIQGETAEQAIKAWNRGQLPGERLNVFYLDVKPVQKGGA